ncbi:MAG: glutamine-hydrolyzing carbamoyl-phosphate synthase small subunit [Bacteroidales bacterium]|nr:glutamine-hydrolyzing carbamoyl-phosphate synthase small subunit [Bacteroidales bacterium]
MNDAAGATLRLANGMEFRGRSFGYVGPCDGEVVFSTAMVGYPESLTDPSYAGQILCVCYPLVGNYGVPADRMGADGLSVDFESEHIWPRGLVVSDCSPSYSHWNAARSLDEWLREHRVPGISGVDTRALTQVLRDQGAMTGMIVPDGVEKSFPVPDPSEENLIARVSCSGPIHYPGPGKRVVLVDFGVKHGIIRCLLRRGADVLRVPWDYDFTGLDYDGLLLSNGPGNPEHAETAVQHIRTALREERPILGICMGHQLLARAAGAKTYKLLFGHRGHNQPVRLEGSTRCFVTSQNHGFAVDAASLPEGWEPWFTNMNDGSNEGIRHARLPFRSVQFHPEAASGPVDTEFLFDEFLSEL